MAAVFLQDLVRGLRLDSESARWRCSGAQVQSHLQQRQADGDWSHEARLAAPWQRWDGRKGREGEGRHVAAGGRKVAAEGEGGGPCRWGSGAPGTGGGLQWRSGVAATGPGRAACRLFPRVLLFTLAEGPRPDVPCAMMRLFARGKRTRTERRKTAGAERCSRRQSRRAPAFRSLGACSAARQGRGKLAGHWRHRQRPSRHQFWSFMARGKWREFAVKHDFKNKKRTTVVLDFY